MERKAPYNTFLDEVSAVPGGEDIRLCIQCGTCTASCPNAPKMEHTPSQLIVMARAGMESLSCQELPVYQKPTRKG